MNAMHFAKHRPRPVAVADVAPGAMEPRHDAEAGEAEILRWLVAESDLEGLPARLGQLARHWLACRGTGDVPQRSRIDPEQLKAILPHVLIFGLERQDGVLTSARIRLMGTGLVRIYGKDWTGLTSHDFHRDGQVDAHFARLQEVADRRVPLYWRQWSRAHGCEDLFAERLFCPLTGAGSAVDYIIGILDFPGMECDPRIREGFGPLNLGRC